MDTPHRNDNLSDGSDDDRRREDDILAYLDGDMSPAETAAFERRMQTDDTLRRSVQQYHDTLGAARDWMEADPPGVERIAQLTVPPVSPRHARGGKAHIVSVHPHIWQGFAAAAIFVAGVLVGHMFQANAKPDHPVITVPPVTTQATPQVTPAPVKPQPQNEDRQLAAAPPRYTDEKGVIVVETTLKGSGARALWVIDGGFQLAQSSVKP